MQNNSFFKHLLFVCIVALFASCDKDFNEIGSDIIGEDHFGLELDSVKGVTAYNKNLGAIQSSNLPINALGYYNNPFFGKTKASFVSQLELTEADIKFINPSAVVIDSVYLYVPYFSTLKEKDSETGESTYELDSIYGSSRFKLSVYESNYYLRDYSASSGFQEVQKYYSNQSIDFNTQIGNGGVRLNNSSPDQNDEFIFSSAEKKITYFVGGAEKIKERKIPGLWLDLDKMFFKNKIVNAPAGKLLNNNVFKEYFRGLYFKAEAIDNSSGGSMSMINFGQNKGVITMVYHDETSATNSARIRKTLIINLGGNTVNLFENDYNPNYTSGLTSTDPVLGDEKLYLKGGEGSMTVIDLFKNEDLKGYDTNGNLTGPNGVSDELDDLRNPADGQKWLINEANLTFYIDKTAMSGAAEPNRIYLYDLNNNRPLIDYYYDNSTGSNAKLNKYVHDGIIEKETTGDKRGKRYKIRLTDHLRNLINNDSTNVKLGLVVTESIATVTSATLKTPTTPGPTVDRAPFSSVINPLGTVLYGSNQTVPEGKRLKLKIYYTKPN